MEHVAGEPHLRGTERIIRREAEDGWKDSALEAGVLRTPATTTQQHTLSAPGDGGVGRGVKVLEAAEWLQVQLLQSFQDLLHSLRDFRP